MLVLGIETSCDDTSIALIECLNSSIKILSTNTFSQTNIHSTFGGVVPEVASRNHTIKIKSLLNQTLKDANISLNQINAIAVTNNPGLIGSLFVGLSFAKGLAFALRIPILPVNHIYAHVLATEIDNPHFINENGFLGLVISGGHSTIFDIDKNYTFKQIGSTRDDATGEIIDKFAKQVANIYPGGPFIDNLAKIYISENGCELNDTSSLEAKNIFQFKISLRGELDFSFSGLKTAVINASKTIEYKKENDYKELAHLSFELLHAISNNIADKLALAIIETGHLNIFIAGGVACNSYLRANIKRLIIKRLKHHDKKFDTNKIEVLFPLPKHCSDNATMIAFYGLKMMQVRNDYAETYKNFDTQIVASINAHSRYSEDIRHVNGKSPATV